jgi:DNA-binding GntR family transcriptional regulator
VAEEASPRGAYLKIADKLRDVIKSNGHQDELPSHAEIMNEFSRGVVIRAISVLSKDGLVTSAPGGAMVRHSK